MEKPPRERKPLPEPPKVFQEFDQAISGAGGGGGK